jgi:hypothetical protein
VICASNFGNLIKRGQATLDEFKEFKFVIITTSQAGLDRPIALPLL